MAFVGPILCPQMWLCWSIFYYFGNANDLGLHFFSGGVASATCLCLVFVFLLASPVRPSVPFVFLCGLFLIQLLPSGVSRWCVQQFSSSRNSCIFHFVIVSSQLNPVSIQGQMYLTRRSCSSYTQSHLRKLT